MNVMITMISSSIARGTTNCQGDCFDDDEGEDLIEDDGVSDHDDNNDIHKLLKLWIVKVVIVM